jgi:nucleotide-binding universal stress UspA family protein
MSIKHLMLPLTGDNDHASVATCALRLAKHLDAHVSACYEDDLGPTYTAPIDMAMPSANYGAYFEALQAIRRDREVRARQHFDRAAGVVGVPLVTAPSNGSASAMWMPSMPNQLCAFDIITDLVVASAPGMADTLVTWNIIEHALFAARRRVLVIPGSVDKVTFARPLIAWNGSHESENAVDRVIALLEPRANIQVVQAGRPHPGRIPARRVIEYLQWHGFKPEFEDLGHRRGTVEDMLLHHAQATHADCIVMGAFTHSRTRELLLGGVTDFMLRNSHIPLLMAH